MKQIKKPSNWLIAILLIPAVFAFCIIVANSFAPVWAIITICLSLASYLAVLTFYCIRQKCYEQLIVNYVVIVFWAIIYLIQFSSHPL